MICLDTPIVVFALAGTLTAHERKALEQPCAISAITLWELAKLVQKQRLDLDLQGPEFLQILSTLTVLPVDLSVALQSTRLDFQGDPADELIAATAIVHKLPLLTRDQVIRRSRLVGLV